MRVLAIGDIHGCSKALATLLDVVEPGRKDLVITLGDYVDRGPDSNGVIEQLLELDRIGRLVPLRGNHDQMMLNARGSPEWAADWLECGGRETLASYPGLSIEESLADVPPAHWDFLEQVCVDWFETETHFFVHANAYPDLPLHDQPLFQLHWERLDHPVPHRSGKVMVCGHTKQPSGKPLNLGHAICLDTGVYDPDGWLTCLDVGSGRLWQTNQQGRQRRAWLRHL
jgi:serine/threonine protein phosphatase 1